MNDLLKAKLLEEKPEGSEKTKAILVNTAKMLLILLATILVTQLMRGFQIGDQSLIVVYCLSVLVISFTTPTYVYGILAALISTFAYDFFITQPLYSFSFFTGLPVTLITMLLSTILISGLTAQMKTQTMLAHEREQRAELLYEINQELLAARDVRSITALTNDYLASHLGRTAALYTRDPQIAAAMAEDPPPTIDTAPFRSPDVQRKLHYIFTRGAAECDDPLDGQEYAVHFEPVVSKEKVLGVIAIDCSQSPLTTSSHVFVQMVAGQVALALELQYLSDEKSHIQLETEREKMRSTLLRSISHDLRTPLTSILGASSTILEQRDLEPEVRVDLARDIRENAQWLIRIVENILVITRISRDMKVNKTPEAAEEVVSQAVSIIRKRFPDCYIHVHVPDELLMVPMDATLISQVIINLLDNAVKNSPDGSLIILDLERKGDSAVFDVHDNGGGIPEELLDTLFELPSTTESHDGPRVIDSTHGMGIGLSICKTIIHAHGGTIEGHNSKNGGATFSFRLPLLLEQGS